MDDFIALRCPSCGGDLQVAKNLEKIFCNHCGTQLLDQDSNLLALGWFCRVPSHFGGLP